MGNVLQADRTGGAIAQAPLDATTWPIAGSADVVRRRARWRRQASVTTVVGMAARGVAVGVRLVTIPLALRLLGPDRYGLWLSVGSLLTWIGFVGPGIGYGLINAVSEATGCDDWAAVRRHVSTAVFFLLGGGLVFLVLAPALGRIPAISLLLGITNRPDLIAETRALLTVTAVLFALSFCLEFVAPLCTGLQEGYLSSVAVMAASVASLVGVVFLAINGGSLVGFALVVGAPPLVTSFLLGIYLLGVRHTRLRPSLRMVDRASLSGLFGFGGWMFVTQVGDLAIFQSANILIASHFGPAEVPRYALPASVFMNVANLCFLIVQPYWPAIKEATVRGDWPFIRTTMRRTLRLRMTLMLAAAIVVVAFGPPLIAAWAGDATVPGRPLLMAMSAYYLLVALSGHFVILLLSFGLVRMKAMLTIMVGVAHVGGFLLLSQLLGLAAMPIAGTVGVAFDCLLASCAARRYIGEHDRG